MDSYLFGGKMSHGQPISITIPLHGSHQHFVLVFFKKKKGISDVTCLKKLECGLFFLGKNSASENIPEKPTDEYLFIKQ